MNTIDLIVRQLLEAEDFDTKDLASPWPSEDEQEYELREWLIGHRVRTAVASAHENGNYLGLVRDDLEAKTWGPFRRDQVRLFKDEWLGFLDTRWLGLPLTW